MACPNLPSIQAKAVYPAEAIALNLARVRVRAYFVIGVDNEIRDVRIQAPNNAASKAFEDAAASMVKQIRCVNHIGHDQPVTWAIDFALQ